MHRNMNKRLKCYHAHWSLFLNPKPDHEIDLSYIDVKCLFTWSFLQN